MGKTYFIFGIRYNECEKKLDELENDRLFSHFNSNLQMKYTSRDGNVIHNLGFVVFFDKILETLVFHLQRGY